MSRAARTAPKLSLPTTAAATAIAPSVRAPPPRSGSPSVRPNCSLSTTSTSSSHCPSDRRHRLPEQSRDLWSAVHGGGRSHPDDRRRSQAAWRQDWHYLGAPHLGLGDDASSACPHDRPRRRHL